MTTTDEPPGPATSLDVARLAGVSRSTVSNILNGNVARFPESTRQRVLSAASELDYQPSLAGRSLVSGRSDTIVVLLPNTTFGSNLQDAVDQVMVDTSSIGGNVVVRFAGSTPKATVSAIMALRPRALVDFGVLPQVDREYLELRGTIIVPSLRGDETNSPDGGIAQMQADALLENGPRSLWFAALSDQRQDPFGPGRLVALRTYCERHGLPEPKQVRVPLTVDGGIAALSEILEGGQPAGVASYNDDVSLAILAAARELQIDVPTMLAVVGVDHTPVGQLWSPPLTTIDTDLRGMVAALAGELAARLDGQHVASAGSDALHIRLIPGGTA